MSYDLVIQPRSSDTTRPPLTAVAQVVTSCGAVAVGDDDTSFRFPDSVGEVDVDVVATPLGVERVEISCNSDPRVGLYRFSATVADALSWEVFDPQGGHTLSGAELRNAEKLRDDADDFPGIGPRTFLAAYFFLPVLFLWLMKGASPRSWLFPIVAVLGLLALLGMAWDRLSRRRVSRRRRTRS